jgi:hypothetical protein
MSRTSLFRFAAILVVSLISACSDTAPRATTGTLFLPTRSVDFQEVCINGTRSMDFVIRNDARATLSITALEVTSPVFKVTSEQPLPLQIPGNGSVTVSISFTPTKASSYSGFLNVVSDSKEEESATQPVQLVGKGYNGENKLFEVSCICEGANCGLAKATDDTISRRPCSFVSFDDVPNDTFLERTVRFENNGCEPLTIQSQLVSASGDTKYFTYSGESPVTLRGRESRDVVVRFSPTGTDPLYPDVQLEVVSDDPTPRTGQVATGKWSVNMIAASVVPDLVVDPKILTFFNQNTGETVAQKFTISNAGTGTLTVDSVTLIPDDAASKDYVMAVAGGSTSFQLAPSGQPGAEKEVAISFTPMSSGSQRATVKVVAGAMVKEVRLVGGIEPTMVIEWLDPSDSTYKPAPINFGAVDTGAGIDGRPSPTRTVRITNTGRGDLVVKSVTFKDPNGGASKTYSTAGFTQKTLKANELLTFDVAFKDNLSVNNDPGDLVVASNDPIDSLNPNGERTVTLFCQNDANVAPVVNTTNSSGQIPCQEFWLDASGSSGPEATDTLTFQWELVTPRSNSSITQASIESPTAGKTRVIANAGSCDGLDKVPDSSNPWIFKVTVKDQYGNTSSKQLRVPQQ